jgi:DNA processing protein
LTHILILNKHIFIYHSELPYQLALNLVDGVGNLLAKNLIAHCGSASAVFNEKLNALKKIPGIGEMTAKNIFHFDQFDKVDNEIEILSKKNIKALFYFDSDYPYRLKNVEDGPIVLFAKGNVDLNSKHCISIVGTRKSTHYGYSFTKELVESFKSFDVTIVSGLAAGTDSNAHEFAVKNNLPNLAVLGHGLKTIYPSFNKKLSEKILDNGALISEYFYNTPGNKENFPQRNRIVAGLSDVVIVIESAKKGGSLITADLANQYNRDVFALPGKINDIWSQGCNQLISTHQADIIFDVQTLLKQIGLDPLGKPQIQLNVNLFSHLTDDELCVKNALLLSSQKIDDLYFNTGLDMPKLSLILLDLEFKNLIKVLPGKIYSLL